MLKSIYFEITLKNLRKISIISKLALVLLNYEKAVVNSWVPTLLPLRSKKSGEILETPWFC